jgi:putative ABC transport system permease protein
MTATLIKLAFAGIRSRLLASGLTILLSTAAAATIVLALEVGGTARDPWQRTFDAANGAHVLASVPSQADAHAIATLPGVAERDEPVPSATATATSRGGTERLRLVGLRAPARVNAPVRTNGAAAPARGIVLERSFADALGLRVGSTLRLAAAGRPIELPVVGTAISPSQPRYPRSNPGLAWVPRATLERIEPDRSRWGWTQALRLPDPAAAPAFAARAAAVLPPATASVDTWQDQRTEALRDAEPIAIILTTYTIVLLIVVFAVVAILVGARATAQYREIGLLKAVGLTPRQITAVFALESAALGLIAVVTGFSVGALLAPRLAAPSAETMLGSPTTAASPWHVLVAGIPILLVLVGSARSATRRGTRFSVVQAIQSGAPSPAPPSRLSRAIARAPLPVPLALGLKDLVASRHRALRLGGAITVTGARSCSPSP